MAKRPKLLPMKYPVSQEYAYRRILLSLNRTYKKVLKARMSHQVIPMAQSAIDTTLPTGTVRQDAAPKEGWDVTLSRIMRQISEDMAAPTNQAIRDMLAIGPSTNQYNKEQWRRLVRSQYGVDPTREDPRRYAEQLTQWSRRNSLLIKDIPAQTSRQIEEQTRAALIEGTNLKDLTSQVFDIMSERTDVTDSRAKLIARDQVSKLNGELTRERQTDLGVEGYIWRTVGDERVRDTHADNDGNFFTWDNPPPETGHPGEDYQCRCTAEPVLPEFVAYEASLLEDA